MYSIFLKQSGFRMSYLDLRTREQKRFCFIILLYHFIFYFNAKRRRIKP